MARTAIYLVLLPLLAAAAIPLNKGGGSACGGTGVVAAAAAPVVAPLCGASAVATRAATNPHAASLADAYGQLATSVYNQLAADADRLWSLNEETARDAAASPSAPTTDVSAPRRDSKQPTTAPVTNFTSLRDACDSIAAQQALLARIADPADPLDDLARYQAALRLPDLPVRVYQQAYALVWQHDYARAQKLFSLLVAPTNPNGFTRGNAIYFLGHLQYFQWHDPLGAFTNLLRVQQFPACLVFTAHAYLHAAAIMADFNMPVHALALLAVDVPCIDFERLAYTRHVRSAWLRTKLHDYTNAVRHLRAALWAQPKQTNQIATQIRLIPNGSFIWDAVATSFWCNADVMATIAWAVTNRCDTPDDRLFLDALLHEWPAREDIPRQIATNRVLNNNIFPRATRRLGVAPFTPVGD
jgi:TolA-binding protein